MGRGIGKHIEVRVLYCRLQFLASSNADGSNVAVLAGVLRRLVWF